MTIISDAWPPETKVLEARDLDSYRPRIFSNPFVGGDCAHPEMHEGLERFRTREVFWGDQCTIPIPSEMEAPQVPEPKTTTIPIYKSKWFWAAVGSVVAVAVVASTTRARTTSEPTTTYGY